MLDPKETTEADLQEVLHLAVSALKEQFLKGNVPFPFKRHLLNLETLVMS